MATSDAVVTPQGAFGVVASRLNAAVASGDYAASTVKKAISLQARLATFLSKYVADIADVTSAELYSWIHLRQNTPGSPLPTVRTMDNRRWAADLFFRELRALGLHSGDPVAEISIGSREQNRCRPLTEEEMQQCRSNARRSRHDTQSPAVWALCECGATASEIANITCRDIELANARVWISGSRLQPR